MTVASEDGEYSIRLEMMLDVPAKYVREVLTDYTLYSDPAYSCIA